MRVIDQYFVMQYWSHAVNDLGKRTMGGTDEQFVADIAPSFREILQITNPSSVWEVGFNAGHSALMFLMLNPKLIYHSVDIADNQQSSDFLYDMFRGFTFYLRDSKTVEQPVQEQGFLRHYDLVFLDGDHSYEAVVSDIEKALLFYPEYILLDDYRHLSHLYVETIVTKTFKDKLDLIKVYEFPHLWKGYSMGLCKVKY